MCGIIGQINKRTSISLTTFNEMRDTLKHRGPDGFGTELLQNDTVALGHRRLSIIDLSEAGRQPMSNEDGSIWLTYNGEVYNYISLKEELLRQGHIFKSNTDSEVLIHGYEEWGIEGLLKKLKGMFAFGIWDEQLQKLFLARDRFGIKPLYFGAIDESFVFSSEIKGIHKGFKESLKVDQSALADFFKYGHIPDPKSIWKGVEKLKPAHFLCYDHGKHTYTSTEYWNLKIASEKISRSTAIATAERLLKISVKEHLISDVPVGVFLSGGYDSSTILMYMKSLLNDVSSFTVGFDKSSKSEHYQAREIADIFDANHHEHILNEEIDYIALVDKLMYYFDEPFAVSSMIPYYYISEQTAKKVKVALVGDGGDEVFAGYNWQHTIVKRMQYRKQRVFNILGYQKKKRWSSLYASFMPGDDSKFESAGAFKPIFSQVLNSGRQPFYEENLEFVNDPLKTVQYLDYKTFITGPALTRADRCSMANSLELRVPFLDHEIYEAFFALHSSIYHDPGQKKRMLYDPLKKHLPNEILNMPKRGFSFQYVNTAFDKNLDLYMKEENYKKLDVFDDDFNHKKVSGQAKFQLLVLEAWAKKYL